MSKQALQPAIGNTVTRHVASESLCNRIGLLTVDLPIPVGLSGFDSFTAEAMGHPLAGDGRKRVIFNAVSYKTG